MEKCPSTEILHTFLSGRSVGDKLTVISLNVFISPSSLNAHSLLQTSGGVTFITTLTITLLSSDVYCGCWQAIDCWCSCHSFPDDIFSTWLPWGSQCLCLASCSFSSSIHPTPIIKHLLGAGTVPGAERTAVNEQSPSMRTLSVGTGHQALTSLYWGQARMGQTPGAQ